MPTNCQRCGAPQIDWPAFHRQRKADAITELLLASACTREMAGAMNDGDWDAIAYWAGVKAPSVATRKLVMASLPRFHARPDAPQTARATHL
jgi:hypothetical protein